MDFDTLVIDPGLLRHYLPTPATHVQSGHAVRSPLVSSTRRRTRCRLGGRLASTGDIGLSGLSVPLDYYGPFVFFPETVCFRCKGKKNQMSSLGVGPTLFSFTLHSFQYFYHNDFPNKKGRLRILFPYLLKITRP